MSCRDRCSRRCTSGRSSSRVIPRSALHRFFHFAPALVADASQLVQAFSMTVRLASALLSSTLALALAALPAAAQDVARDTALAAPVVVTATRSPLSADRTPSSVTVLSGEKLRDQGISTLTDALRQVPGLSLVQTGSYGGATSLFIRGGESKY